MLKYRIILWIIICILLSFNTYAGKNLKIGINQKYPPHEFFDYDKPEGFDVDILKSIAKLNKLDIKFISAENDTVLHNMLKSGKIDLAVLSSLNADSNKFYYIQEKLIDIPYIIFVQKDVYSISSVKNLEKYTVALVKNSPSYNYLKQNIPNTVMIFVEDPIEAMKLVSSGDVFAYFGDKYTGLYYLQELNIKNLKIVGDETLLDWRVISINKKNPKIKEIFDKGLINIKKNGDYLKIYNKWFGYSLGDIKISNIYKLLFILCVILIAIIFIIMYKYIFLKKNNKDKQKEIATKEKKYQDIIYNTNNGILCINDKEEISMINSSMLKILGEKQENLLNKNINKITNLDEFINDIIYIIDSIKKGEKNIWINYNINIKGKMLVFIIKGFDSIDEFDIRQITLIFNDMSKQEKLQEQLYQTQKMDALGRLVNGISHDFNNSLTGIISAIEFIRNLNNLNKDTKTEIDVIEKFAYRAKELTNKLGIFSEQDQKDNHPEVVDLNDLLLNIQNILKRIIRENIEINLHLNDSLKYVKLDPVQLEFVLIHLVINSLDAIVDKGKILVKTANIVLEDSDPIYIETKNKDYVLLEFIDNGRGMDQETCDHVFEPFFSTKDKINQGLGLFMVYRLINANNGYVEVESQVGKGTTFKIYFPARAEKELQVQIRYQKEGYKKINIKGKNIYIVEDDDELRELLKTYLSKIGSKVFDYGTGSEVLKKIKKMQKLKSSKIDLLIMDVILPDSNGIELYKKINKVFPGIKVIFMSGYSTNIIKDLGLDSSNYNFIQKPFSLSDLLKVLKKIL